MFPLSFKALMSIALQVSRIIRQTSICRTVRSRKVFSFRTLMRLLGPLQPMLVPRPPLSFTTTSLFRLSAMLSGRPFDLILSYGWIWNRKKTNNRHDGLLASHHQPDVCYTSWSGRMTFIENTEITRTSKYPPDAFAVCVCLMGFSFCRRCE